MIERMVTDAGWEALKEVMDPETGLNVVDLGLIYEVAYDPPTQEVTVTMTFTTPACPAGGMISEGVERRLAMVPTVKSVKVDVTFDPRWTPDRISPAGRAELGLP